jgi:hypothetical protein
VNIGNTLDSTSKEAGQPQNVPYLPNVSFNTCLAKAREHARALQGRKLTRSDIAKMSETNPQNGSFCDWFNCTVYFGFWSYDPTTEIVTQGAIWRRAQLEDPKSPAYLNLMADLVLAVPAFKSVVDIYGVDASDRDIERHFAIYDLKAYRVERFRSSFRQAMAYVKLRDEAERQAKREADKPAKPAIMSATGLNFEPIAEFAENLFGEKAEAAVAAGEAEDRIRTIVLEVLDARLKEIGLI